MAEELATFIVKELIVDEADKLSTKDYSNPSKRNGDAGPRDLSPAAAQEVQPLEVKSEVKCCGCRCNGPGIWKARARCLFILSIFGMMMSATLIHAFSGSRSNSACAVLRSESESSYAYAGIILPIVLFFFFEVNPWSIRLSSVHAHRDVHL